MLVKVLTKALRRIFGEAFDPFEYIEVTYEGVAQDALPNVNVNSDDERFKHLVVTYDYPGKLAEGDSFKVHVIRAGVVAYEKEFVVEGVEKSPESEMADELVESVNEKGSTADVSKLEEKETELEVETKEETKNASDTTSGESYILLADGTKIYEGQSIKASDIAGAKFILQGVPRNNYWSVSFLSWGPCSADDPYGNWAYDQNTDAGGVISLDWPASTLGEFSDADYLYVGISTKDYSFYKDWNFKLVR